MDGIETTKQIREEEANLNREATPIIALTAHTDASSASAALKAGMNGFIPKPLTPEKAMKAIKQWCE